ncbi:MAG: type I restriction enzyme HsdR N-terminal domain-containing protein [Muribaculaceae bacterium]|nr:type I restriction enzyme HsdR N-terminal domain-containing protein [Bacteroidales bacterium]MDD6943525.1 type I restriction enzyme HsdR N-terminal domain-containing protein [Bacteroidales bacterium]MDY2733377.1 type I restriction enzyme HsdR N-terminal domain-containing protein [Muribaculaceae bacterium]MDY4650012.1 type I restriction enzyme HsdR N-terminal domain-containing protein [Muribaculaceae bacterium]MDY5388405.1 type I restriction enzyme HsdR N-terminal domain-containing protein [M
MTEYPKLNLPAAPLRLRRDNDIVKVFDRLRDKWVTLTPEEWVRQNFVAWLRDHYHYPESLTANEIGIEVNGTRKRCDTVVYGRNNRPLIIVEYKAPDVTVTQAVFDQIVRYNMSLHAEYLVVSNGMNHYCCKIDYVNNTYHFIPQIPDYHKLIAPLN